MNLQSRLTSAAEQAYHRGQFDDAVELYARAISMKPIHERDVIDYLMLSLCLYSAGRSQEAAFLLKKAQSVWPCDPRIHENLGVVLIKLGRLTRARSAFQRAVKLGSRSPNVLDGLCQVSFQLEEFGDAVRYGRLSLEVKNAESVSRRGRYALPSGSPPVFDPSRPDRNVICYGLWDNKPRYIAPLLENMGLRPHLFPSWSVRVYQDATVPGDVRDALQRHGAQLVERESGSDPFYTKLLWRLDIANAPDVDRYLIRDADSLLSVKERVAVDAWLASSAYFHVMRDFYTHTDLMLAGMWGGVGAALPDLRELLKAFKPPRKPGRTFDQDFLGWMVWPTVSQSCVIHDSVFTGTLGSVPFPPYGALPPGRHIGENAFARSRPPDTSR